MLSNRVEEMFIYLKKHYDYIFIDTPPVGYISDGIVLLKHVDASVFVMNTKMANRKGLKYLEEIVEKSQLTNKGIVLNGVRLKRWKYYYGKYGYGYGVWLWLWLWVW